MKKKKLLITGVSGLLGSNLAYYSREKFDVLGIYHTHDFMPSWVRTERADLTLSSECRRLVRSFSPDICIHCAALADIDRCEKERALAYQVNFEATCSLAQEMAGIAGKFVFISTDAVYGGGSVEISEEQPVRPLNYYAETKVRAEVEAVRCPGALIVRTSFLGWNLGAGKASLAEWAFNELSAGRKIHGFTDVITSSMYTLDFADVLERALEKDLSGIYNFSALGSMSKDGVVRTVARLFGFNEELIESVSLDQSSLKARRSKGLNLSPVKLSRALGVQLPTVAQGIENFYRDRGLRDQLVRSG